MEEPVRILDYLFASLVTRSTGSIVPTVVELLPTMISIGGVNFDELHVSESLSDDEAEMIRSRLRLLSNELHSKFIPRLTKWAIVTLISLTSFDVVLNDDVVYKNVRRIKELDPCLADVAKGKIPDVFMAAIAMTVEIKAGNLD